MYNQVTLLGNLGSEVELRYTPTGTPVCTFRMATNSKWTKDGEKIEKSVWHRITLWRADAENAAKYLGKGDTVMVIGETEQPSAYINKNQEAAAQNEVTGRTIKYIKTKGNAGEEHKSSVPVPADAESIPF